MRLLKAFSLSFGLHAGVIAALSIVVTAAVQPATPVGAAVDPLPEAPARQIEVAWIKIPRPSSPVEGNLALARPQRKESPVVAEDPMAAKPVQARPVLVPPIPCAGPTVTARVVRVEERPAPPAPSRWMPRLIASAESQDAFDPVLVSAFVPVPRAPVDSPSARRGEPQGLVPPTGGLWGPKHGDPLHPGGDALRRVELIQARINAVTPLVHSTAEGCRDRSGEVRVRFRVQPDGYSAARRILRSSGNPCLDAQVETIIHLAEPYPYVADWVPVTVKFTL
jgi:TonB family protein